MSEDDRNRKPRQLIFRAQAECLNAIHQYRRARLGTIEMNEERARRELHAAVMMYWDVMSQYRNHDDIETIWHDRPVSGEKVALEQLRDFRNGVETETREQWDPQTGTEQAQEVRRPWTMDPTTAFAVRDQLDRCAQELGLSLIEDDDSDTLYTTKRDPEKYDEPIKDDIPKPS